MADVPDFTALGTQPIDVSDLSDAIVTRLVVTTDAIVFALPYKDRVVVKDLRPGETRRVVIYGRTIDIYREVVH